jgi:hypothetical protein
MGINIETKRNGKAEDGLYTMSTPSGAAGNIYRVSPTAIPLAQYIGQRVKGNSAELSARVSDIIRSKRLPELVAAVSLMAPGVTSLQVLQGPSGPTVVADVSGEFVPTALLGDGFNNYLQVVAGLLWASGGVLFLDEVDVSFHYSVRRVAWKTICGLASAQNCQIFSVSHSMEAITDACRGAIDAGCEKDFEYIRLEHTGGVYAPVRYSAGELLASEQANIDVR